MSQICISCGHSNKDTATVCQNCSSSLSVTSGSRTKIAGTVKTAYLPGELIDGRYRVEEELGRGGMGIVYKVRDNRLSGLEFALKMIHPHLVANPEARKRFENEVATCLSLEHPAIIRVNHFESNADVNYFTMMYLDGISLSALIEKRRGNSLPLFSLKEIDSIFSPLLSALSYAHKYTIHRDLKPDNIMVLGNFPEVEVKILDFGIARTMSISRFTQTAQSMGTPYYMAPEQLQESKTVDHRADIYSVGMVLYEMLTGELAVGRFPLPSEVVPALPVQLDEIIDKTLSPFPARRYQSALEVKRSLSEVLTEQLKAEDQWPQEQRDVERKRRQTEQKRLAEEKRVKEEKEKKQELEEARLAEQKSIEKHKGELQAIAKKKEVEVEREAKEQPADREEVQVIKDAIDPESESVKRKTEVTKNGTGTRRLDAPNKKKNVFLVFFMVLLIVSGVSFLWVAQQKRIESERLTKAAKDFFKEKQKKDIEARKLVKNLDKVEKPFIKQEQKKVLASNETIPENSPSSYTDSVTGMEFVFVKGGCFQMGQTAKEKSELIGDVGLEKYKKYFSRELPQHEVCLDGFYLGKFEVTQGEYQKIAGNNPSEFKNGSNYPVEKVSWNDSQSFIKKLNSKTGKSYRLPTEAEWEYAARAGTTTPFSFGNTISTSQANYDGNYVYAGGSKGVYRKKTTPVGEFQPNNFGLYDMHGNVWEWCQDWFGNDYYASSPRSNPPGPSSGSGRVVRGGGWCNDPGNLRSANRGGYGPGYRSNNLGFRLVLPVQQAR